MATQPTLAGFNSFVTKVMGIKPVDLPANSVWRGYAFANALAIVNPALRAVAIPQQDSSGAQLNNGGWSIYALAVYNLAADNLINYAPDQQGRTFFADIRKALNITGFVSGVVQSSGDDGSSVSVVVQEAAKAFTLADIQNLKTSYGRTYLGLAQAYGPATWGMS